jgi:hypothetical protein
MELLGEGKDARNTAAARRECQSAKMVHVVHDPVQLLPN